MRQKSLSEREGQREGEGIDVFDKGATIRTQDKGKKRIIEEKSQWSLSSVAREVRAEREREDQAG